MAGKSKLEIDLAVRFRDLDAMGHVNNAVVFTYFEEGRKDFFAAHLGSNTPLEMPFILAHVRCDYIRPILMQDRLRLVVRVGDIGRKSFRFQYNLTNRDDEALVYAKGESVQVWFDYRANRSVDIPPAGIAVLERFKA